MTCFYHVNVGKKGLFDWEKSLSCEKDRTNFPQSLGGGRKIVQGMQKGDQVIITRRLTPQKGIEVIARGIVIDPLVKDAQGRPEINKDNLYHDHNSEQRKKQLRNNPQFFCRLNLQPIKGFIESGEGLRSEEINQLCICRKTFTRHLISEFPQLFTDNRFS